MKLKKRVALFGCLLSMLVSSAVAFASCDYIRNTSCDENRNPGSCVRMEASYDACVQRENAAQEARARRDQERQEAAEREALRKLDQVQKAVKMNNNGGAVAAQ